MKLIEQIFQGSNSAEYVRSIVSSVERHFKDNVVASIRNTIQKKQDQIVDLKHEISSTTDVNAGINALSREQIINTMDSIYSLSKEIKVLERELKEVTEPFISEWFEDKEE